MNTTFQKYAAALLPFFILVVGASQTVLGSLTWQNGIPFAILVAGAVATYVVRILPGGWQGGAKTGIAIFTAIAASILPFLLPSGFDPSVNLPIIVVAILNALATELGVQIRVSPLDTPAVPVPVVEVAPTEAPPEGSVYEYSTVVRNDTPLG